jgi:hypothetical protein
MDHVVLVSDRQMHAKASANTTFLGGATFTYPQAARRAGTHGLARWVQMGFRSARLTGTLALVRPAPSPLAPISNKSSYLIDLHPKGQGQ